MTTEQSNLEEPKPGCLHHIMMLVLLIGLTSPAVWLVYLSRTSLLTIAVMVIETGVEEPNVEMVTLSSIIECENIRSASFTGKKNGRSVQGVVCCSSESACQVRP